MIIPLGGGGSKVVASIVVSYPAGSTLTCTLGSKILTAKDTSGKWVFGLPSTGNWVVKAVKGSQSTTKTISITAEGQAKTVTLGYDYIIFSNATGLNSTYSDGGGGCTVTVGTDSSGKKILTYPADGYSRMAYLKPPTDLTKYTTLKISGYVVGSQDRYFGVWNKVPQEYEASSSLVAKVVMSGGTTPTSYTINVSSLSGNYYFAPQYYVNDTIIYDLRLV